MKKVFVILTLPEFMVSQRVLSSWIRKQNQFAGFVGSKWGYEYLAEWNVETDQH